MSEDAAENENVSAFMRRRRAYRRQIGDEQEIAEEEKNAAIDDMVGWFSEHFEDPANQTPWDGEDETYIFVSGGPYAARDVIWEQYGDQFPEGWIESAVREIERDGIYDWAPTPTGDYYEHPEDGEAASSQVLVAQLQAELDDLEAHIEALPVSPGNVGHNMPPEEIGLPPYTDETRAELVRSIEVVRTELESEEPNRTVLEDTENRFRNIGSQILKWTAQKADLAVDEAIKSGIRAFTWTSFAAGILSIAGKIASLLGLLP